MDPLVMSAASALVGSMATDAWQQARSAVLVLWQRTRPDRVPSVAGRLAEVREDVRAAREIDDRQAEEALALEWAPQLQQLLTADPALRQELQRVLDEVLRPLLPPDAAARRDGVRMQARGGHHSRIYQANGDMTFNGGSGD
ncbi:hypothetical protein ABZ719_22320 [Streptomyces sp. NPDC006743]|uniref:hypothetical protein n=1 Tax=Streptomyces sp. NPDC006743 TaxID=3154480 RepID=UPI0034566A51